jgi:enamine deaminase RidA (YjgF/YER057c/UK114 family)
LKFGCPILKRRTILVDRTCQVSGVKASEFVFIPWQTSTDIDGNLVGAGDFEAQCKQVFADIEAALRSVGASWTNAVHFINY